MDRTNLNRSLGRWVRLTAQRVADDAQPLGWALAAVAALNLVWLALFRTLVFSGGTTGLWPLFVTLASVVAAASAFRTMHEGRSSTDWLLWPASSLEKFAAAVTASVVLVPLGLTAASTLLSVLLAGLEFLVTGRSAGPWVPWSGLGFGLPVLLLVVIAGATTFRKHVVFKTGLLGLGALAVLVGWALIYLALTGGGNFQWNGDGDLNILWNEGKSVHEPSASAQAILRLLAGVWAYGVLPAFCLAFGWAKVGEKEARDEVQ